MGGHLPTDPPTNPDPYADLGVPGYDIARSADPTSLAPEIALIRSLIAQSKSELRQRDPPLDQALRLQKLIGSLTRTLATTVRLQTQLDQRFSRAGPEPDQKSTRTLDG